MSRIYPRSTMRPELHFNALSHFNASSLVSMLPFTSMLCPWFQCFPSQGRRGHIERDHVFLKCLSSILVPHVLHFNASLHFNALSHFNAWSLVSMLPFTSMLCPWFQYFPSQGRRGHTERDHVFLKFLCQIWVPHVLHFNASLHFNALSHFNAWSLVSMLPFTSMLCPWFQCFPSHGRTGHIERDHVFLRFLSSILLPGHRVLRPKWPSAIGSHTPQCCEKYSSPICVTD